MLIDSNDSPPVCESSLYRASLDEGAVAFDPPLIIKVRDADATTDINYRYALDFQNHFPYWDQLHIRVLFRPFRILGNDNIQNLFAIDKHTGQLFIKDTVALDVNHLKSENIFFSVEVNFSDFLVFGIENAS